MLHGEEWALRGRGQQSGGDALHQGVQGPRA